MIIRSAAVSSTSDAISSDASTPKLYATAFAKSFAVRIGLSVNCVTFSRFPRETSSVRYSTIPLVTPTARACSSVAPRSFASLIPEDAACMPMNVRPAAPRGYREAFSAMPSTPSPITSVKTLSPKVSFALSMIPWCAAADAFVPINALEFVSIGCPVMTFTALSNAPRGAQNAFARSSPSPFRGLFFDSS